METISRKTTYLSETEFALCCTALGIGAVPCFAFRRSPEPEPEALGETLRRMAARGLLREGERLTLSRELTGAFRVLKQARRLLLAYRALRETRDPCCLLYAAGDAMVSVTPGRGSEEYAAVTSYGVTELREWLEDLGLLPDLAEGPPPPAEEPGEPEGDGVAEFLLRTAWPEPGAVWDGPPPEEAQCCLDCRAIGDGALEGRLYLLRQSLYDRLVLGTEAGITQYYFTPEKMAELAELLLRGGERL